MPHMIPEYAEATPAEPWQQLTSPKGETFLHPFSLPVSDIVGSGIGWEGEPVRSGHFARLSAPGYLDATDWAGPFETLAEAREHIADTFDVDPETGVELSE